MKRDARIGLAVVLVLGGAATLLVVRSIYNRQGENLDLAEASINLGGDAPRAATELIYGAEEFILDETRSLGRGAEALPRTDGLVFGPDAVPPLPPEPPARLEPAPTPAPVYAYTAVSGDNLWKISAKIFGDGKYAQKIKAANGGNDRIKIGALIRIPALNQPMKIQLPLYQDQQAASTPAPVGGALPGALPPSVQPGRTHTIVAGDTLAGIAQKYYASSGPKSVDKILNANKGISPARLKIGQELAIP